MPPYAGRLLLGIGGGTSVRTCPFVSAIRDGGGPGSGRGASGRFVRYVLEHLCRYVARPPLAAERLTLTARGHVRYEFRRPWRNGTTHVEFEPLVFLERLAALVPPPRMHLQTYHGVLAPGSTWRDDVVPRPVPVPVGEGTPSKNCSGREQELGGSTRPRHRYLWPELMRRVFGVEVLRCGVCHSLRRLIAVITQRHVIVKILAHLELETEPPPVQPARAPPQLELAF